MRKEWFDKLVLLDKARKEDIIQAEDLSPYVYDKTLIYGYTCERLTFHVYIKNRKIYTVVYNTDYSTGRAKPIDMRLITVTSNKDYVPDKRIYPERCEYHFCKMLQEREALNCLLQRLMKMQFLMANTMDLLWMTCWKIEEVFL